VTTPTLGDPHRRLSALIEVGAGFHLELTGFENVYLSGSMDSFGTAIDYQPRWPTTIRVHSEKFTRGDLHVSHRWCLVPVVSDEAAPTEELSAR